MSRSALLSDWDVPRSPSIYPMLERHDEEESDGERVGGGGGHGIVVGRAGLAFSFDLIDDDIIVLSPRDELEPGSDHHFEFSHKQHSQYHHHIHQHQHEHEHMQHPKLDSAQAVHVPLTEEREKSFVTLSGSPPEPAIPLTPPPLLLLASTTRRGLKSVPSSVPLSLQHSPPLSPTTTIDLSPHLLSLSPSPRPKHITPPRRDTTPRPKQPTARRRSCPPLGRYCERWYDIYPAVVSSASATAMEATTAVAAGSSLSLESGLGSASASGSTPTTTTKTAKMKTMWESERQTLVERGRPVTLPSLLTRTLSLGPIGRTLASDQNKTIPSPRAGITPLPLPMPNPMLQLQVPPAVLVDGNGSGCCDCNVDVDGDQRHKTMPLPRKRPSAPSSPSADFTFLLDDCDEDGQEQEQEQGQEGGGIVIDGLWIVQERGTLGVSSVGAAADNDGNRSGLSRLSLLSLSDYTILQSSTQLTKDKDHSIPGQGVVSPVPAKGNDDDDGWNEDTLVDSSPTLYSRLELSDDNPSGSGPSGCCQSLSLGLRSSSGPCSCSGSCSSCSRDGTCACACDYCPARARRSVSLSTPRCTPIAARAIVSTSASSSSFSPSPCVSTAAVPTAVNKKDTAVTHPPAPAPSPLSLSPTSPFVPRRPWTSTPSAPAPAPAPARSFTRSEPEPEQGQGTRRSIATTTTAVATGSHMQRDDSATSTIGQQHWTSSPQVESRIAAAETRVAAAAKTIATSAAQPAPSSSSSTLVSRSTLTRLEQAQTAASQTSVKSSARSSAHPFATPLPTDRAGILSPQHSRSRRLGLPSSHPSPDPYDPYDSNHNNNMTTTVPAHQVTLVSSEDEVRDSDTCPVCCESLSFTFRLPGEKPHIVPECGHSLHEECFVTVYGPVPPEGSRRNLGVCGVCRQPMRVGGGGGGGGGGGERGMGKNKLAALMGDGERQSHMMPHISSSRSMNGAGGGDQQRETPGDDAVEPVSGASNSSRSLDSQVKVVIPAIAIKSEFSSVRRARNGKQVITAIVSIEVPLAKERAKYPAQSKKFVGPTNQLTTQLPPSPRSPNSNYDNSHGLPSSRTASNSLPSYGQVAADLRNRVIDYKTSGLDVIGQLKLFETLNVRKGDLAREFHVYLFQEALICISEGKKSGLRGIFSSSSSNRSDGSSLGGRGMLKLKGRIYIRHVRSVVDSSMAGELSLSIAMDDDTMDSFILVFKERSCHETWKIVFQRLIDDAKSPVSMAHAIQSANKVAKLTGTPMGASRTPLSAKTLSPISASSSQLSGFGKSFGDITSASASSYSNSHSNSQPSSARPHSPGLGDLAFNIPLAPVHTPLDLVVVLSMPGSIPTANNSLPLKIRLMRSSIQFVLACMGPNDRISLVATELGQNGTVRKTPFLNATHNDSRRRLENFVDDLGNGRIEDDEFEVEIGMDERQDVVTAVNVALDVVLQRKSKNPLTGIVLISDTADVIKRTQMDLVTARLDAANVPVHALGYGKAHDPSPLWMMSNHTHGTYTFVKEWYHLRDALAGVLGGLMSIALTNMKLHLTCQENDFRVTKVSGTSTAIVSTSGKDVDIELRELRHGERREILVEFELEGDSRATTGVNGGDRLSADGSNESGKSRQDSMSQQQSNGGSVRKSPSFNLERSMRLDTLSVTDSNALREVAYEDTLMDEVPVVEIDCSFHDPAAGRSVARLAHPVLLTLAILPPSSAPSSTSPEPTIVRRRMELLGSDMITRALLIASRKNFAHATRILRETRRIIETVADGMRGSVASSGGPGPSAGSGGSGSARSRRQVQTMLAIDGLTATVQDVDMLLDGLEVHQEMFERDHRNYAAQQAIILRSQKSWTVRTPTELLYATRDVQALVQVSGEYASRI